jgi:hypothetical protein
MNDDRGQALVVAVLLLAIAAAALVAIRAAQDRLLGAVRSHRAGEAAVEAAAAAVADAYVAHLREVRARAADRPAPTPNVHALVADSRVLEAARMAALELAAANGAGRVGDVAIICAAGRIDAHLALDGYPHRAGFNAPECSLP